MTTQYSIQATANFERNLEELESFLIDAGAGHAFDALLAELADTVISNLERFPAMGRLFLERPTRSVEAANGIDRLTRQLAALAPDAELREYVMAHYLLLYARFNGCSYLLSIRHQRQLSFDLPRTWPA
ncbi:type II toxin-antitoxin system RelE/ParE family toxin [Acidovorax sp. CCYZU-2555]|uniref:type II toxin-antitoxin system RelE/ParE family toxin n=1 Tax=Acidovorax sp. CCYZU-2555 TaxID=2835042 RepID=UPI001BD16199|nr:type II toxin-antitoxin system RelE/ParE family toxin [Acidovorax sp. CCYZU-2555]